MQSRFTLLIIGLVLLMSAPGRTQTTSSPPENGYRPMQVVEPRDPITADENRVLEDKAIGPADADFMPGAVPQPNYGMEPSRGSRLDRDVSPEDVLITHDGMDLTPSSTKGPYYDGSENELRGRKLARGVGNVFLSVAEIPNQAFQEAYRTSPVSGFVVGAGKGVWKGIKRLAIGTWEIATFYFPGKNNYQPYIQPEVVFQEYLH